MNSLADIADNWGGRTLLALSEVPSFEGELKIRLVRKLRLIGPPQFFVLCTKNFPLNQTDVRLAFCLLGTEDRARAAEARELFRNLRWQLRVPDSDISTLSQLLEEVPQQEMPARGLVLDGTTYKLSFRRGLRKRKFNWLSEAPPGWESLIRIKEALIRLAEVHAKIDSLDWKRKIKLLSELEAELRELREQQRRQKLESIKRNNETCQLARIEGVPAWNNLGRYAEAVENLRKAETLLDPIVAADPHNRNAIYLSANAAHDRVIAADAAGEPEQMIAAFRTHRGRNFSCRIRSPGLSNAASWSGPQEIL
jgi:hypothetical protein